MYLQTTFELPWWIKQATILQLNAPLAATILNAAQDAIDWLSIVLRPFKNISLITQRYI